MIRRTWLAAATGALLVLGLGTWLAVRALSPAPISIARGDVSAIVLQPIPEGPTLEFTGLPLNGSWTNSNFDLSSVARFIPVPLPGPEVQGSCQTGGDLLVFLRDGRRIVYGPCHHPAQIRALWRQIELIASGNQCLEPCAPDQ